ncbi:hypothetical protein [Cupriavidus sp. 2SB]|uniref:hypothetical protein n=1 Tax=Cupriavidus sp. 2SB TaxID=2502199 RepID=UPI0010F94204|nr:hypothetical protein [Cupriavidus sp. 2SB]
MRKLLTFLTAALLATLATAQTKTPIQLLNPAGSTAGQAIVSTGPSTSPTWGAVAATALAPVAANTFIANVTGSTAAPTAVAAPSCSTANSALKYTSGTGLSCGTAFALTSGNLSQFAATTSAQLLGVLSDETGSGLAVFGTSPSLTTPTIAGAALSGTFSGTPTFSGATTFTSTITPSQTAGIVGTTTNNNANAGSVGEFVTSTGTLLTSIASATPINLTSISLTAGDWDVTGSFAFFGNTGTVNTQIMGGVSTVSATLPAYPDRLNLPYSAPAVATLASGVPTVRVSVASTTTVYLIGYATFSGGTTDAQGKIRARRVR